MTGEKDLDNLLKHMSPALYPGAFVFCSFEKAHYGDHADLEPIAAVTESEGLTLIIPVSKADAHEIPYETVFSCITLNVHSSLDAVGLTAVVSSKLTEHGISANVIAGYFHDHIFVQAELADKAITAISGLTMKYRSLSREEIKKLSQIDRTEDIGDIYYLRDGDLVLEAEHHAVSDWSISEKQRRIKGLQKIFDEGATFFGAFDGDNLVGMSVLDHNPVRSGDQRLNLAGLWVSHKHRGKGVGKELFLLALKEARNKNAKALYVSATPSKNTVHFYMNLGCTRAEPIDEYLFEEEPEDIHLELVLVDD